LGPGDAESNFISDIAADAVCQHPLRTFMDGIYTAAAGAGYVHGVMCGGRQS
jgi:hypothetical protein